MKTIGSLLLAGIFAGAVSVLNAAEVRWEAENAEKTDLSANGPYSARNAGETEALSNGKWLNGNMRDAGSFAEYAVEVPEDGAYFFYIRRFWMHGPIRWRFNEGEWTELKGKNNLDSRTLREHVPVCWVKAGTVELKKGTQKFRFELLRDSGYQFDKAYGFDCFLLSTAEMKFGGTK